MATTKKTISAQKREADIEAAWRVIDVHLAKRLKAAASTEESRPILNSAHVTPRYIEATNGHLIVRQPWDLGVELPEIPEGCTEWLLPRESFAQVKATVALAVNLLTGAVQLWAKAGKGGVTWDRRRPRATLPDMEPNKIKPEDERGQYPNVDAVIPDYTPDVVLCLSATYLRALADMAEASSTGRYGSVGKITLFIPPVPESVKPYHVERGVAWSVLDEEGLRERSIPSSRDADAPGMAILYSSRPTVSAQGAREGIHGVVMPMRVLD